MEELLKREIPAEVVQYHLYLNPSHYNHCSLESALLDTLDKCIAFIMQETEGHIWQNESFNLRLVRDNDVPYLFGSTNYGECLDDEWFIVYLIHKLTKQYPEVIASIIDNDGQFLLIEAADYLPKWITPDTSENRVFISLGVLHILLKPHTPGHISFLPIVNPSIKVAIDAILKHPAITQASPEILSCIKNRIDVYPQKAIDDQHYVNVFLPKTIVFLLDQSPNLISKCVNAFYLRDPIDLGGCRNFKYFPPVDRVWTQIQMTRYHYAQLTQQRFVPDKRSGYKVDMTMTPDDIKGYDLGMKLAHGFEIICYNMVKSAKSNHNSSTEHFVDERRFSKFVTTLRDSGYFQEEIEGSKLYQKLYLKARNFYEKQVESCPDSGSEESRQIFHLLDLWKNQSENPPLKNLQISEKRSVLPDSSSDSWMCIAESDIDGLMGKMSKGFRLMQKGQKNVVVEEALEKLHQFVDDTSELDGIEIRSKTSGVDVEPSKILKSLESLLGLSEALDDNEDSEALDEFLSSDEESDADGSVSKFASYLSQMDEELSKTAIGESFTKENTDVRIQGNESSKPPTDVDTNLIENFSQGSQMETGSGPITNLLNSIGVQ